MGRMTVVSILNDAWPIIKENPDQFIKNIEEGMDNCNGRSINMYPVGNHANPMEVHRSFHSSLNHVMVVGGNHMEDLVELRPSKLNDDYYLSYKMKTAMLARSLADSVTREIMDDFANLVAKDLKNCGCTIDDIGERVKRYDTFNLMDEKEQAATIFKIGAIMSKT